MRQRRPSTRSTARGSNPSSQQSVNGITTSRHSRLLNRKAVSLAQLMLKGRVEEIKREERGEYRRKKRSVGRLAKKSKLRLEILLGGLGESQMGVREKRSPMRMLIANHPPDSNTQHQMDTASIHQNPQKKIIRICYDGKRFSGYTVIG